jgi:hypothetical protein
MEFRQRRNFGDADAADRLRDEFRGAASCCYLLVARDLRLNPAGFTGSVAQPDVVAEVAQPALRLKLRPERAAISSRFRLMAEAISRSGESRFRRWRNRFSGLLPRFENTP